MTIPIAIAAICIALGVAVGGARAQTQGDIPEEERPYLIALKCPEGNGGILEFEFSNRIRERYSVKIVIENGQVAGGLIHKEGELDATPIMNKRFMEATGRAVAPLIRDVCQGSEEVRSRFFMTLEGNRKMLGIE